ncbi:MAG TPA: hypothetical protein EYM52_08825 [Dehalococcoidia bacterium]|jgi:uncharacterized sulfatase|nr:hypothetical protein [Dehalococcoidia bacterium]
MNHTRIQSFPSTLILLLILAGSSAHAANHYVDSKEGSDDHDGLTAETAWQSLTRVNSARFSPGDSIFFKSGQTFKGTLKPQGNGTPDHPIVVGKYGGDVRPVIDGRGKRASVHLVNNEGWEIASLELINDGGTEPDQDAERYRAGVYVAASSQGLKRHIVLRDLKIHRIYPSQARLRDRFEGKFHEAYGIHFFALGTPASQGFEDIRIEDCEISDISGDGIWLSRQGWDKREIEHNFTNVVIRKNHLHHIGGAGLVPMRCKNLLVEDNVFSWTGASDDPRQFGMGSGMYAWNCADVLIQRNRFERARGWFDSAGAHIDLGNRNLVYQYNVSYDNAGGFIYVFGDCSHSVFRHNLSINDGSRLKGSPNPHNDMPNDASRVIMISDHTSPIREPVGSRHIDIHNNTIYVASDIKTTIQTGSRSGDNLVRNNIFYVDGEVTYNGRGDIRFDDNLYWGNKIGGLPVGPMALFADPKLVNPGDASPMGYRLTKDSPAIDAGVGIAELGPFDFWGDKLSKGRQLDIGADEYIGELDSERMARIAAVTAERRKRRSGQNRRDRVIADFETSNAIAGNTTTHKASVTAVTDTPGKGGKLAAKTAVDPAADASKFFGTGFRIPPVNLSAAEEIRFWIKTDIASAFSFQLHDTANRASVFRFSTVRDAGRWKQITASLDKLRQPSWSKGMADLTKITKIQLTAFGSGPYDGKTILLDQVVSVGKPAPAARMSPQTRKSKPIRRAPPRDAQDKPNFVIILTDDQGVDDFGREGDHPYLETPNLDKLRNESVHLTNFHVMPVCAPTRAALLTGRHPWRTGVTVVDYGWSYVNLDEVLFPQVLKQQGYRTGMWGKWHCGDSDGYYPWERGFEEAYMTRGYVYKNNFGFLNGLENRVEHRKYSMEALADYAIDFIERNREQPFCAYLPFITPHSKYVAIPGYYEKYKDKGLSDVLAKLYGTIECFDSNLGRIFARLEELGLDENTVVIFQSDNGPNLTNERSERHTKSDWATRNTSKLRGNKTHIWENGIKTPCFIRWAGTFEPKDLGFPAGITDIFPTVLDLAGIDYESRNHLDGASLVPLLADDPSRQGERVALADRYTFASDQAVHFRDRGSPRHPFPDHYRETIRFEDQALVCFHDRFKLLQRPFKESYLYHLFSPMPEGDEHGYVLIDLQQDPMEKTNVIKKHPVLAANMQNALKAWFADVVEDENFGKRPELLVGHKQKETATVNARCASRIGGGFSNVSPKLQKPGDFGEFNLIVRSPGEWEVFLDHARTDTGRKLQVSIGEQKHMIQPTGTLTRAGRFTFSNQDERLTLRIEANPQDSSTEMIISRLKKITLRKVR